MAKAEAALKVDNHEPKQLKSIAMNALQLFDFGNANWRVVAPPDVTPEDLENPFLWNVVGSKLRPFDSVTVLAKNARWWAELLVIQAERGFAPVLKCLRVAEFDALPDNKHNDLPAGYRIDYDATSSTYRAYRDSDNVPMTPPLPRREDVRSQLVNNAVFRK